MRISIKAVILGLMMLSGTMVKGQSVKDIYVSNEESYTDHIALKQDSRDTDVMVKFQYSEEKNTLTLSVISYRSLFVFREPVRYQSIINFFGRIIPDKFPYVINAEPKSKFRFSKELIRTIKSPRSKYIFNKWVEYKGLQPQPTEFQMVNDYIEQVFDVLPGNNVSVTLRDVYLLEGQEIMTGKDLQTRYNITIGHNPCFGKDEEISAANTTLENLFQNYNALKENSKGGVADSQEIADVFGQLQQAVMTQFTHKDVTSSCTALQNIWNVYNDFVDSVAVMKCVYTPKKLGVDASILLKTARTIDGNVSRWLLSDDPVERRDMASANEDMISDIENMVKTNGLIDAEQRRAYSIFQKAANYSRQIIK